MTAIVLVLDEASCIERCLAHLRWADEVLVVDSGSTDGTQALVRAAGARVVEQPWLGWSQQRNAGAAAATHDWVVFIEADEVMSRRLVAAVKDVLGGSPDPRDAWAMARRDEFWGRLLPQSQRASKTVDRVRLYHRGASRWDESMLVHEEVLVPGAKRLLDGYLVHWRPQRTWEMAERIGRYSAIEAASVVGTSRMAALLRLFSAPAARFAWLYLGKGAWRLGIAGYVNSVMRAHADFLRWSEHLQGRSPSPADPPHEVVDDSIRTGCADRASLPLSRDRWQHGRR